MESTQSSDLSEDELEEIERWFVRQGLPNLIDEYSVMTDVFNRAVPVLVVFWLFSVLGAYGDRFEGWGQAYAALGAASILLVVGVSVNVLSGRPALKVPARVGYIELAIFVVTPALLPVLLRTGGVGTFLLGLLSGLFMLCLVWFVYGFGLGHILRWAVIHLGRQISSVLALMIRSLPLLLLFTMFLFLNAELWQVAQDFTTPLFFVAAGGLLAVSFIFVAFRLPQELADVARFNTTEEVNRILARSSAPIEGKASRPGLTPKLSKIDQVNVAILAIFSIGVQIALVMIIVGAFYLLFGLVSVREDTIAQWTTSGSVSEVGPFDGLTLFGADIPLTSELLKVTGFLMAFTALQFTVSALTDATYRKEFLEDLTSDIREALAVRTLYLERLGVVPEAYTQEK